jgi:hypothetical protein
VGLHTALLWMRNGQAEIELADGSGLLQPEDTRSRFTIVNRAEYRWRRGALEVRPRFKHRFIRESVESEEGPRTETLELMPIVTGEYRLTGNTRLIVGVQGIGPVPYKYVDRVDKDATFGQTDYSGMLKITSEYQGINTSLFVGYQRLRRQYDRDAGRSVKQGTLFLDIISAF